MGCPFKPMLITLWTFALTYFCMHVFYYYVEYLPLNHTALVGSTVCSFNKIFVSLQASTYGSLLKTKI